MWDNELGLEAAKTSCTSGARGVQRYGEIIWDHMCFRYEGFKKQTIIKELSKETNLAHATATQYVNAFFAYCKAAHDDFSGPNSRLVRKPHYMWALEDNPER